MRALIFGANGAVGNAVVRRACERGLEVHAAVRAGADPHRLTIATQARRHVVDLRDAQGVARLVELVAPQWVLMAAFPAHTLAPDAMSLCDLRDTMQDNAHGVMGGLAGGGFSGALTWIGSALASRSEACALPSATGTGFIRGEVKAAESRLVADLAQEHSLPLTELRLFTAYGPWEQRDRLVPSLLRAALTGGRVPVAARGTRRDWLHYQDLSDACLASARWSGTRPRILDACSGTLHGALEVARLLEEITDLPLVAEQPFEREEYYGDASPGRVPALAELDWQPRIDLRSGLEQCWRWATSPAGERWLLQREPACA